MNQENILQETVSLKRIPFAPRYFVSKSGNVFKENGVKLKAHKKNGYFSVNLNISAGKYRAMLVHRIVAITFIPNPENKPQVNYKNCDRGDNRVENLEWVTAKENTVHAIKFGSRDFSLDKHPRTSLTVEDVLAIYDRLLLGESSVKIAKDFKVLPSCVADISKRRTWAECTKHLPDIGDLTVRSRISDDDVHKICVGLQSKMTAKDIIKSLGAEHITIHQIYDIKRRRYCKHISCKYNW